MNRGHDRILLYGYGNPGRGDDGLGPALAAALDGFGGPGVAVDANYQLTVEDAAEICAYAAVVFADAAVRGPAPFCFARVSVHSGIDAGIGDSSPGRLGWTSHSVSPAQVVGLARGLFGSNVQAYTLGIRGYEFAELEEVLSAGAKENLAAAVTFAKNAIVECRFEDYLQKFGPIAARNGAGGPTWKAQP
jgi:hydrogenase maturation protease